MTTPQTQPVPPELARPVIYHPGPDEHPKIDRAEVLRYLGYTGQEIEPELSERIEGVIAGLERSIAPRGVRQVFAVNATGLDADGLPCIRLAGTAVELTGRDIFRHLKDASYCALLACTLGMDAERELRTLGSQQPLESAVYDAACSAYVEAAVEEMDAGVKAQASEFGLKGNWRFSCGYGDCPLDVQPTILAALNATRLIGLTVTTSNLMLPSKSVTAMIGLFEGEPRSASSVRDCRYCRVRQSCAFRRRGTTCYGTPVRKEREDKDG